ncbi:ribonuclease D [Acetobacter nitrogenifigens DSM 23921 = NBRC 105050]|uniref:Ribonuclease D n=2 Tax=Acetobacter nitrogenifigens TaxID=285268 RepID=A0A511XCK1_9PROT|nr:ribonuclease D [Acetobacter nitrogenifigens DSM 23921 = NBRC 105050]GEN60601.1 ribonuclease D [Acetobacter nitrogenifigens DSM 23921 = NBRC 105050]
MGRADPVGAQARRVCQSAAACVKRIRYGYRGSFRSSGLLCKKWLMAKPARHSFPEPRLIVRTDDLAETVSRLRNEPFVTVDTEFMRERTYWPELCLVQLAGASEVALVDALAPGLDLTPLAELFDDTSVVKVLHAARQDLEIFLHLFDRLPTPMFDTQVAAMVAGYGEQVGYDNLVGALTGAVIDKSHRFTDWSARPLSQAQLTYAAADVTHLRDVYEHLLRILAREERGAWVASEQAALSDPERLRVDPERQWERLKARTGNRRMLGVLRAIAAWREIEAQNANIPRQRMLKDESLLEIAATAPRTVEALARVRGVTRGFAEGKSGAGLLEAVEIALELPDAELPRPARGKGVDGPRASPALVALLKVLLAHQCEKHDVAQKLVATSDELDAFALEQDQAGPIMTGWRRDVFGEEALALCEGRLSLGVKGDRVELIRKGDAPT